MSGADTHGDAMNLGPVLGRWQYLRGKSLFYIEALRSWVTPAAAAGAFAKYLGAEGRWAVIVALVVPLAVELAGFVLGRFLYEHGGVEQEYQMALDRDPFKRRSLEQFEAIRRLNEETLKVLQGHG